MNPTVGLACVWIILVCLVHSSVGFGQTSATQYVVKAFTLPAENDTTIVHEYLTADSRNYLTAALPNLPEPNKSIISLALKYPEQGIHDYWWPRKGEGSYDGSTTDVLLNGSVVMKGEAKGRTFCCGLTLEVFYRYLQGNPSLAARIDQAKYDEFKRYWFCREINSPGPLDAMSAFKVGTAVEPEKAMPGDFVQIWRNNRSGHSVLFVNWIRDQTGKRVGLQYWSTQPATEGIGFNSEFFGSLPKQLMESKLSIARPILNN